MPVKIVYKPSRDLDMPVKVVYKPSRVLDMPPLRGHYPNNLTRRMNCATAFIPSMSRSKTKHRQERGYNDGNKRCVLLKNQLETSSSKHQENGKN
jgi:hypothetical protein